MAGLTQMTKAPVQTCNLQTDDTGHIKPGAKAVSAQSAVTLPVLDAEGRIAAIVSVAFAEEGEVPPAQVENLMTAATGVPRSA
jgi:hypothetical protein